MILLLDCGSKKTSLIAQCVDEFMDIQIVELLSFEPHHLLEKKGVILSGAPLLITEINLAPYLDKISWISATALPVLGVCFGHQLIGIAFGSFGSRMREDRSWQTIEVFESCSLFQKLPNEIEMMEDHCESISIPPGFDLVASSDVCVNEAMQHKTRPIFGVQFHPESSGNHGKIVLENFITLCSEKDQM
jgi:GMP synthase (glutamine-hydrolysing)